MKKLFIPLLAILALSLQIKAQVKTNFNNTERVNERGHFNKSYATFTFEITPPDLTNALRRDKTEDSFSSKVFYIAEPVATNINVVKLANWVSDDKYSYGKFTLIAKKAKTLSINFSNFFLPKGTEMFIYNREAEMITGVITEKENNESKLWGSSIYKGDEVNIEIKLPIAEKENLSLQITNVAYGYKDIFVSKVGGFGQSGACNINVLCPLGNNWVAERNSVVYIARSNGDALCSGAMLMNTCATKIPYVLTADHCFQGDGNVAGWRVHFQAWSATCTPNQNSDGILFNGSTLRANWAPSDFCLIQLNQTPAANSGIHYAGWNRQTNAAISGVGIHHPSGDVMKISSYTTPLVREDDPVRCNVNAVGVLHWVVQWNQGVTERGSSGSPLFDQNHRIVGQLSGGPSSCGQPANCRMDMYGRFDNSWTGGGTNSTRLSNWLDPNNMNLFTTNTTNIADLIPTPATGLAILGKDSICSSEIYTVNVPTGTSVSFTVSTSPNSGYASYTVSGNQVTITRNGTNIGTVQITATVTDDCGNQYVVNRTVYLGPIPAVIMGPYDPVEHIVMGVACVGEEYYFAPSSIDPTATYTWKFIPPVWSQDWEPTYLASGPYAYFTMPDTPRCYTVRVEKTNACGGTVVTQKKICVVECNAMRLLASPNPATSLLTVTLIDEKEKISKQIKQENIQIELYNLNVGIKQKEWKYNTTTQRQFTLNIADIAKGMYVVKVTKGKLQATIKIIKN